MTSSTDRPMSRSLQRVLDGYTAHERRQVMAALRLAQGELRPLFQALIVELVARGQDDGRQWAGGIESHRCDSDVTRGGNVT